MRTRKNLKRGGDESQYSENYVRPVNNESQEQIVSRYKVENDIICKQVRQNGSTIKVQNCPGTEVPPAPEKPGMFKNMLTGAKNFINKIKPNGESSDNTNGLLSTYLNVVQQVDPTMDDTTKENMIQNAAKSKLGRVFLSEKERKQYPEDSNKIPNPAENNKTQSNGFFQRLFSSKQQAPLKKTQSVRNMTNSQSNFPEIKFGKINGENPKDWIFKKYRLDDGYLGNFNFLIKRKISNLDRYNQKSKNSKYNVFGDGSIGNEDFSEYLPDNILELMDKTLTTGYDEIKARETIEEKESLSAEFGPPIPIKKLEPIKTQSRTVTRSDEPRLSDIKQAVAYVKELRLGIDEDGKITQSGHPTGADLYTETDKANIIITLKKIKGEEEQAKNKETVGGKIKTKFMKTSEKALISNNRMRLVYLGPKGGKYVKVNGSFVTLKAPKIKLSHHII